MSFASGSVSVTLDATGAGTGTVGPGSAGTNWQLSRLTTNGNSTTEPSLKVYRGSTTGPLLDTTKRGNADVSETNLALMSGEFLTVAYAGGTPGAHMTFYVEGQTA